MKWLLYILWFLLVGFLSSQAQQPLHLASRQQQQPPRPKHRVVITNRTVIEDGNADHSYNIAPAVVDSVGNIALQQQRRRHLGSGGDRMELYES